MFERIRSRIQEYKQEKMVAFLRKRFGSVDGIEKHIPHDLKQRAQLLVDVFYTSDDELVVTAFVGGVKKNEITIALNSSIMVIYGNRGAIYSPHEDDYVHKECFWGPFARTIVFPDEADHVRAKYTVRNGLLTIKIPLADPDGPLYDIKSLASHTVFNPKFKG